MKEPKCSFCGGPHYKISCFTAPKKQIKVRGPIKNVIKKPIKKNKRPPQRSTSERSILTREADRVFSIYIRLINSISGRASCVTCGYTNIWEAMQNGHFISRRKVAVRWDEMNCHVQCSNCNEALGGNMYQYKIYMNATYGVEAVDQLRFKSMSGLKVTNSDIQDIIDKYTLKIPSTYTKMG